MGELKSPQPPQNNPEAYDSSKDVKAMVSFDKEASDLFSDYQYFFYSNPKPRQKELESKKSDVAISSWELIGKNKEALERIGFSASLSKTTEGPNEIQINLADWEKFQKSLSNLKIERLTAEEKWRLFYIIENCIKREISNPGQKGKKSEDAFEELDKRSNKLLKEINRVFVSERGLFDRSGLLVFLQNYQHAKDEGYQEDLVRIYEANLLEVQSLTPQAISKNLNQFRSALSLPFRAIKDLSPQYSQEKVVLKACENYLKILQSVSNGIKASEEEDFITVYEGILIATLKHFLAKIEEFQKTNADALTYVDIKTDLNLLLYYLEGEEGDEDAF